LLTSKKGWPVHEILETDRDHNSRLYFQRTRMQQLFFHTMMLALFGARQLLGPLKPLTVHDLAQVASGNQYRLFVTCKL
jgi:hypothetical protein